MADKRPALGKGLSALIPDAAGLRAGRRSTSTSTCSRRTASSRARRSTTPGSPSSPSRSGRTASSSRSSCAARTAATRSSPASAAGAPRSWPGTAPRPGRRPRGARGRGQAARAGAHREHPARGPEPDRGGDGVPPPAGRVPPHAGADRGRRRQGPLVGGQLPAPAQAARATVQLEVASGRLSMGHARALLGLDDAAAGRAARDIITRGLSVRDTEALVAKLRPEPGGAEAARAPDRRPHEGRRGAAAASRSARARGSSGSARAARSRSTSPTRTNCSGCTRN